MADRVLIVDDEPDVAHVIHVTLQAEGFETMVAHDGIAALELAREETPDIILADVMMPGMDGVELCKRLRATAATAAIPIIMLTAKTMPADRVLGLTAGADDYVAKPFDVDELVARIESTLRRATQLRGVSPLTGLPGNFEISRQIDTLLGAGAEFAAMHIDIDDFKAYNDYYGFVAGDAAIQAVADALVEVIGGLDGDLAFLGHVGGDDFVALCSVDSATAVAEAMVRAVDAAAPALYAPEDQVNGYIEVEDRMGTGHRYPFVSVSIGIATTATRSFESAAEVAAVAGELKSVAKGERGGSWRIDRRRVD